MEVMSPDDSQDVRQFQKHDSSSFRWEADEHFAKLFTFIVESSWWTGPNRTARLRWLLSVKLATAAT